MDSQTFNKRIDLSDGGFRFRLEREKARTMYQVLHDRPFVTTPAILEENPDKGELIFERLAMQERITLGTTSRWFALIGESLGLVHKHLKLEPEFAITRKKDEGRHGLVFIHGDFWPGNLAIAERKLVLFDWGVRPWMNELFTIATPALDIASFLVPWLTPRWFEPRFPARKLKIFLTAYFDSVGSTSSIGLLARKTLREALVEQYDYVGKELLRRNAMRRSFLCAKTLLNIWRLENEVIKQLC